MIVNRTLLIGRTLFLHSVRSLERLRLILQLFSRSYGVRLQGVATYNPSASVVSLCRRSSSDVPTPLPRSVFRSSALRASSFLVVCSGRLVGHSLKAT